MRRPLPWPASRVDDGNLYALWCRGRDQRRPITALLAEAVARYLVDEPRVLSTSDGQPVRGCHER